MICYLCRTTGDLIPANLIKDNIFLAIALLKRHLQPEELDNELICNTCQTNFTKYVEEYQNLVKNVFSHQNNSAMELRRILWASTEVLPDCPTADYLMENIILVETDQLPSAEHQDPDLHTNDFNEEIVSSLDHPVKIDHEDISEISEMPEKVFANESFTIDEVNQEEVVDSTAGNSDDLSIPMKNCTLIPKGGFKCSFCDFTVPPSVRTRFSRATTMCLHLQDTHFIRVVICEICGEEFSNTIDYTAHRKYHLKQYKNNTHNCSHCSEAFSSAIKLINHNHIVHPDVVSPKPGPWACELCNKKCNSKALLEAHQNIHKGLRPYECDICKATFTSKYIFNTHQKIHTDRPRPFKCSHCEKPFLSLPSLIKHELTHSKTKDFECHVCQKTFMTVHNLRQHQVIHNGQKPFTCKTCGKTFARRVEIQDHERTHSGEKPFVCDICGSGFAQRSNLATHKRTIHLKQENYKCGQCSRSFKRRRLLDCHVMAVHLKERPFKCSQCPQAYRYPEHLKKHIVSAHGAEKQQSCEICDKRFHSTDARNLHRFVHSTRKMYECTTCGKGFMRRPLLISHMKLRSHMSEVIRINFLQVVKELANEDGDEGNNGDGGKGEMKLLLESRIVGLVIEDGEDEEGGRSAQERIVEGSVDSGDIGAYNIQIKEPDL